MNDPIDRNQVETQLRSRVSNAHLHLFSKFYGIDPAGALAGGNIVWFRPTRANSPIRSALIGAIMIAAIGAALCRPIADAIHWPPMAILAAGILTGAAASYLVAHLRRGTGIGIQRHNLTFRRGQNFTTHPCSSVNLIVGTTPFIPEPSLRGTRWSGLLLQCEEGTNFHVNGLENYESEVAYALLSSMCPRALAIRPDGQVDLGGDLTRTNARDWRTRVRSDADRALGRSVWRLSAAAAISLLFALAFVVLTAATQQHHRHPGVGPIQGFHVGIGWFIGGLILAGRVVVLSRRRAMVLNAIDSFDFRKPEIVAALYSEPEPEYEDPLVAASRVPIVGKIFVVLALLTFYIPLLGIVPSLLAVQGTQQMKGPWRIIAKTCLITSYLIGALLVAGMIVLVIIASRHGARMR